MRSTTLPLDAFGKEAIERYAETNGMSPSAVACAAARRYLELRGCGRPSWKVPRFVRQSRRRGKSAAELEIDLDEATWVALEEEAARQGVSPSLLLLHAMLHLIAAPDERLPPP
jgi:hypothetical protein